MHFNELREHATGDNSGIPKKKLTSEFKDAQKALMFELREEQEKLSVMYERLAVEKGVVSADQARMWDRVRQDGYQSAKVSRAVHNWKTLRYRRTKGYLLWSRLKLALRYHKARGAA